MKTTTKEENLEHIEEDMDHSDEGNDKNEDVSYHAKRKEDQNSDIMMMTHKIFFR